MRDACSTWEVLSLFALKQLSRRGICLIVLMCHWPGVYDAELVPVRDERPDSVQIIAGVGAGWVRAGLP